MNPDLDLLIKQAFQAALQKGNPDWNRMTVPVLKNRMLHLTNGAFKEQSYGYASFRQLVEGKSELLRIDASTRPVVVEIIDRSGIESAKLEKRDVARIRRDLWRAVTDYASGRKYVWDEERRLAVVAHGEAESRLPQLPTISADELSAWRQEFLEKHAGRLNESDSDEASRWGKHGLAINFLPVALRSPWAAEFSSRVASRITDWFSENSIPLPELSSSIGKIFDKSIGHSEIRQFIVDCINVMTDDELEKLQMPASVLIRVRYKK